LVSATAAAALAVVGFGGKARGALDDPLRAVQQARQRTEEQVCRRVERLRPRFEHSAKFFGFLAHRELVFALIFVVYFVKAVVVVTLPFVVPPPPSPRLIVIVFRALRFRLFVVGYFRTMRCSC
jgi:hypothetical protein